jgi:pimeloyl-ACP methyl ester carboxylesterase
MVAAKHQIVSFDAPSHGTSGPGRMGTGRSSGIEYAQALQAVSRSLGSLHAVVGYSLGAHVLAGGEPAGLNGHVS